MTNSVALSLRGARIALSYVRRSNLWNLSSALPIIIFLLLFSCRKEQLPQPTTGSPVFYFKGTINNQSVNLNAGVNDYYLFSSYSLTTDSVNLLSGQLKDQTCTSNCTNALTISIGDYKKRNGSPVNDIQTVLKNTSYKIYAQDSVLSDTAKRFQFTSKPGYQSYAWTFGDGSTSALQNPTHVFNQQNSYNVCLTVNNGNGCEKTMCNTINSNQPAAEDLTFSYSTSGNTIQLQGPPGWNSYLWYLSDSATATTQNVTHTYRENAIYTVCLTATKSRELKTFCQEISVPGTYDCDANWTYTTSPVIQPVKDSILSKIIVAWTDQNGKTYNSTLQKQPASSYFTIKSGNTYLNNANGQKTYQFNCKFDLLLFDPTNSSSSLHITSSDCNWGVAFP